MPRYHRTAMAVSTAAAIVLAALPGALGAQESRNARMLKDAFGTKHTDDNYKQRLTAVGKLRGTADPLEARALVDAYRKLDAEAVVLRKEQGEVLDNRTSLEVARFRKDIDPIDTLEDELYATIRGVDGSLADVMLDELVTESRTPNGILSLQLLLAEKSAGFRDIDLLRTQVSRPLDSGSRIAFFRVVATLGPRGNMFASFLERELEAESATVRLEAARALGAISARRSVPKLIDRLANEQGRVKETIAIALANLTSQNHGLSAEGWKLWLKSLESPDAIEPPSGTVPPPPKLPEMGEYFGIAQDGASILYVFDRSDSMERGLRSGGIREQRARRELADAIVKLDETTRFNIVAFSIKVRSWAKGFKPATKENIADARRWVFELDMQAGTSTYDALQRSFRLSNSRTIDRFDELDVETIFFLSDGEPTRRTGGTLQPLARDDPQRILSAVRRWNALGRVKIHTVGLALETKGAPILMRGLAEQSGGTFVAIR
ncbi:MAG: hypothetical protein H6832_09130 [Planctomycetes bacterium]|nr:hypothetical protein [Planctomycetota bacterium]MCB9918553.1 hypothetical protein [Planctomycetota bacterium]